MGHVRDRMSADLKLAGRSESTREQYIRCARAFVKYYMRPPEELGEEDVRAFLLYLIEVRKVSVGRYLQFLGALKFMFTVTLGRPEVTARIPWPRRARSRPNALTLDEVARVLAAARTPFWRVFLMTAYATGLRRMEVAALRAQDIDSRSGLLRVAHGKGSKAREVMLDPELLIALREHWRIHALPGPWLFPAQTRFGGWADRPVALHRASAAMRDARIRAKIARPATLHWLRHSFATHLLEDGTTNIIVLQRLLGHDRIESTQGYTHVRTDQIRATPSPLSKLPRVPKRSK